MTDKSEEARRSVLSAAALVQEARKQLQLAREELAEYREPAIELTLLELECAGRHLLELSQRTPGRAAWTPRKSAEVVRLRAHGHTIRQIAEIMSCSERTVRGVFDRTRGGDGAAS